MTRELASERVRDVLVRALGFRRRREAELPEFPVLHGFGEACDVFFTQRLEAQSATFENDRT